MVQSVLADQPERQINKKAHAAVPDSTWALVEELEGILKTLEPNRSKYPPNLDYYGTGVGFIYQRGAFEFVNIPTGGCVDSGSGESSKEDKEKFEEALKLADKLAELGQE